jgi:uncharacterized repeat protein (TIGR01451 family)
MRRCCRHIARIRSFAVVTYLLVLASYAVAPSAYAAFDNTTPRGTFAGHHNYVVTGGSLRTQSNDGNACAVGTTSTATLSGIPDGSTILAAYLYWGGSGPTPDNAVTFGRSGNTTTVSPQQTFTDNFTVAGSYDFDFFGGFRDVTSQVTGNGNYTFGNLAVATTDNYNGNRNSNYCANATVVAGWSLVVVYANPSERYRYTRIYDGLRYFRGSSVTTTQSGFRVPDLVDGTVTVVTWEGDPDTTTSQPLDGYNEELSFDGHVLRNLGCDANNNNYNSTIGTPSSCSNNTYGVDVDTYNVTSYLHEGQTGATLEYSSGNDLVLLAAQVISTTNTPVADLGISKTHSGNFTAGANGTFAIGVHNYGPEIAVGQTTVTDTLPAGMSFVSGSGSGWSCSAAGQTVTCTSSIGTLAVDADLPTLNLTVAVAAGAAASLQNTATVAHPMFDGTGGNQSATDTVTIVHSDLSTSTKSVADPNGGDAVPGDKLRYTITLKESAGAAASNVSVIDALPANTTGLTVVSVPAGATNASTASQLSVSGISLAANGTATIVFDVTVGNVAPGTAIDNTATIANPGGPGASPAAATVTVSQSQVALPASGSKVLYLYDDGKMRRGRTGTATTAGVSIAGNGSVDWTLAPALVKKLTLSGNAAVNLRVNCTGGFWCGFLSGSVSAELRYGSTSIATSAAQNVTSQTVTGASLSLAFTGPIDIPAGTPLVLRIRNGGYSAVQVYEYNGGQSTVSFLTPTVINVDSVDVYSVPYGGTTTRARYIEGTTVYVRAVVSDPFGPADITGATLLLTDAGGTVRVNDVAMALKATGTATKTFEGSYAIPANPRTGTWTAKVTAIEGTELDGSGKPLITHSRSQLATVEGKVTLTKAWGTGAVAGNAVSLAIAGGHDATAGSSTAPSTTVAATASAPAGATLTLSESFTSGSASIYSPSLACTRAKDGAALAISGTGLSRSATMPNDSAVACVWTNSKTTPLTVVKTSTVVSDPVNGTVAPKAIPGAVVEYRIILANPAPNAVDSGTLFVTDPLPSPLVLRVADLGGAGSGPVAFVDGSPSSGLAYTFSSLAATSDDLEFSNDGGATWTYVPMPDAGGYDAAVNAIRVNPKGAFQPGGAQFQLRFRARIP